MFYVDECVRSSLHGLGLVIRAGESPVVGFLDGPHLPVDGRTLHVVPDQVYNTEVRNRFEIERWLDYRTTGRIEARSLPLPVPRIELAEVMRRSAEWGGLPIREVMPGAVPRLNAEDEDRFDALSENTGSVRRVTV